MRLNLENDYAYRIILKFTTSPEGKSSDQKIYLKNFLFQKDLPIEF